MVGYAWTVQIGGTSEPSQEATSVEFAGIERMNFNGDPKYRALNDFRESTPMSTVGTSSLGLPPFLRSFEAAEKTGVRIAAMTYCGFINSAGAPREQDMQAVVDAVTALASALESPLREATLSSESLERAGVRATDVLLEALLEELDRQGLSSSTNELVRDLQLQIGTRVRCPHCTACQHPAKPRLGVRRFDDQTHTSRLRLVAAVRHRGARVFPAPLELPNGLCQPQRGYRMLSRSMVVTQKPHLASESARVVLFRRVGASSQRDIQPAEAPLPLTNAQESAARGVSSRRRAPRDDFPPGSATTTESVRLYRRLWGAPALA